MFADVCTLFLSDSGERVYDISFWKTELNSEVNAMATEIENLKVTHHAVHPLSEKKNFVVVVVCC